MFAKLFTVLFVVPAIFAKIEIDLLLNDASERDVRISGMSVSDIGENEMSMFGLNWEKLKKAATTYMGKTPDNIFLNGPTPWGDLFETMQWEPTRMTFAPKNAAILSVKNEEVMVKSKEFHNTKAETTTLKVDMRQVVRNIVTSKWEKEVNFDVENILYKFDMKMLDTPFSFLSNVNFEKTIPLTMGGFTEITLKPKQNLVVELHGNAELMVLRVDYEANLTGNVALNFENDFNGHRFWSLDINTLLSAGGLKNTAYSSEIIDMVHFTGAKVLVRDLDTNEVIYTAPLSML